MSSKGATKRNKSVIRAGSISSSEIHVELKRILSSGIFATADRMKRFLRFVVEETIRGKGDDLNEYMLGVEVYDRDETFDPRVESIVRVDAGRLRSKLREFYMSEVGSNSIQIEIPKGSYKPSFKKLGDTEAGTSAQRAAKDQPAVKIVAVLPFGDISPQRDQEYFGDGIAEELMFTLSRVPKLRVVSQNFVFASKGNGMDIREICRQLGIEFIVEGSVRKAKQKLRITIRLTDVTTGFHIWSEVYDCELRDVFSLQEQISKSVTKVLRVRV